MRRASGLVSLMLALGAGCGPSEECKRYVACQKAFDPSVDTTAYDAGGSCWTTPQTASACTEQCRQATEAIAATAVPPVVCTAADPGAAETDAGPE